MDEEEFLYEYDAMVKAGEGIEIRTEKDFDALFPYEKY